MKGRAPGAPLLDPLLNKANLDFIDKDCLYAWYNKCDSLIQYKTLTTVIILPFHKYSPRPQQNLTDHIKL